MATGPLQEGKAQKKKKKKKNKTKKNCLTSESSASATMRAELYVPRCKRVHLSLAIVVVLVCAIEKKKKKKKKKKKGQKENLLTQLHPISSGTEQLHGTTLLLLLSVSIFFCGREMRSSPPPARPAPPSSSPRPKESSFLQAIGAELSAFGLVSSKRSAPSSAPARPAAEARPSHRPAPPAPSRSQPPQQETARPDLSEDDFHALAHLLEGSSEGPDDSNRHHQQATASSASSEERSGPRRSSAELEKELLRMSLSELAPAEDAPAPPLLKRKGSAPSSPAPGRVETAVVVAAGGKEVEEVRAQLAEAAQRESELMARLVEAESQARRAEAASKMRVQELEMQLDALVREKEGSKKTLAANEELTPTRDELLAAMDAYRGKLAETDAALSESEERKGQLRDDLRKLITKSKEIEGNAKQWKQRSEDFEAKFSRAKDLARDYADRCKALEKERKATAAAAAAPATAGSADESSSSDQQVASMERRAKKAEEMAKLAVAVIKKSGSSEQRKELAAALQLLQASTSKSATAEAKADRRKSPREPLAKVDVSPASTSATSSPAPSRKDDPGKKSPRPEVSSTAPVVSVVAADSAPASPPPSAHSAPSIAVAAAPAAASQPSLRSDSSPPPVIKSPRLDVISEKKSFLSPQVARKQKEVESSAGGSKTPNVQRKKEAESVVTASPSVSRRGNPGRSAAPSPQVQPKKVHAQPAPKRAAEKPSDGGNGADAFSLLEDVLSSVEKETGATGLTGAVDVSHVFGASTQGDASSYLASMRQEATAEEAAAAAHAAKVVEMAAAAKREAALASTIAQRDAHRHLLGRFLEEEANYIEASMKDPLNPMHALLPLLNRAEKVQTEAARMQLLDEAADTDFVGSELVLRVTLVEARDLKDASSSEVHAVLSVKAHHETSQTLPLPSSGVVQWNETFLFPLLDASSRLTLTIMSKKHRLGVAQVNLRELRGFGKEYYPIVDNSSAGQSVIRGMLTAVVSLHIRTVKKVPQVVVLDPNSKSYQDAVRHGVARIKRSEENKPREREFNASVVLTPLQKEMDQPRPNLAWIAAQIKAGNVAGNDPFENVYRRTLLHLMVIAGDIEMVEKCFAAGADPKKRDAFGLFPFHLAIVFGHLKLLQNMLPVMRAFGQSVHTPENACGLTPVHLAAIFNRPKILEWLLDQGADVDDKDDFGGLPIHKAAFVGSLGCVQALVNRRAFVKAEDIDGNTPLLLSMKEGHWDVADYLLTNNVLRADIDTTNLAGETVLWHALSRSNKRFTKMFLDSPSSQNAMAASSGSQKWSVLMRALNELDDSADDVIKLLIDAMVARGVGLNHRGVDGKNAAFVAAFKGKHALLGYMVSRGLDVLAEDDNANTALHFSGTILTSELLLRSGAQINSKNHQGNTALHVAYAFHPEVTDFLISQGANANVRNQSNQKPSDCSNSSTNRIGMSFSEAVHRGTCGLFIK